MSSRAERFRILAVLAAAGQLCAQNQWPKATPESVGLDPAPIKAIDAEFASGRYADADSMLVIRCGKNVFESKYAHDYGTIYYKEVHTRGPLNARLTGIYNYFDPQYHPYYKGTDAHTMQSVTKTITSVTIGVAMTRDEFKGTPDTPILKYFDASKVKNVDDRKRRITVRDLLTMRSGLEWNEDLPYNDPKNSASMMEASDDWVQFVIDRPMAYDPGTHFAYSSGGAELLAYVFRKATGKDIEEYAKAHLFGPLGFEHQYWKRTPLEVVDTEGGLYFRPEDLAKIGQLFLHDGMWNRKRIVSSDWVKQSLSPTSDSQGLKYGFEWWLVPHSPAPDKLAWAALGFGGQRLLVIPEDHVILVFTAWNIAGQGPKSRDLIDRISSGVHEHACPAAGN